MVLFPYFIFYYISMQQTTSNNLIELSTFGSCNYQAPLFSNMNPYVCYLNENMDLSENPRMVNAEKNLKEAIENDRILGSGNEYNDIVLDVEDIKEDFLDYNQQLNRNDENMIKCQSCKENDTEEHKDRECDKKHCDDNPKHDKEQIFCDRTEDQPKIKKFENIDFENIDIHDNEIKMKIFELFFYFNNMKKKKDQSEKFLNKENSSKEIPYGMIHIEGEFDCVEKRFCHIFTKFKQPKSKECQEYIIKEVWNCCEFDFDMRENENFFIKGNSELLDLCEDFKLSKSNLGTKKSDQSDIQQKVKQYLAAVDIYIEIINYLLEDLNQMYYFYVDLDRNKVIFVIQTENVAVAMKSLEGTFPYLVSILAGIIAFSKTDLDPSDEINNRFTYQVRFVKPD